VRKSKQISVYRGLILFHRKHPDERLHPFRRASLIDC